METSNSRSFRETLSDIHEDLDRYVLLNPDRHWLTTFLVTGGIWVTMQYRLSRWVHYRCHLPILRQALKVVCFLTQKLAEILGGIELPNRAQVGKGLLLAHPNGIVIHMDAKIGDYCNIGQQVTIGIGGRQGKQGTPYIGDRVFIAPGAKLFGPITIGNHVAIGANAVVTKDIPDNAVAVGIPAKVISFDGSGDFIKVRNN